MEVTLVNRTDRPGLRAEVGMRARILDYADRSLPKAPISRTATPALMAQPTVNAISAKHTERAAFPAPELERFPSEMNRRGFPNQAWL